MELTSNIEETSTIARKVTVSIAAAEVGSRVEEELNKLTRTASLKGFRPGKAPRAMIEKLYAERVRFEVADRLISKVLGDISKEKNYHIVGTPKIDLKEIKADSPLEFTADFEIFPEPEVKGYEKFSVKAPKKSVEDKDVDALIERIRESRAQLKKIELRNTARKGDIIDAQVQVNVAGEKTPGRAEPQTFQLGEGRLPQEVESGIEGMETGSAKEITAHLPEDYRNPKLRGKDATYVVTLNSLYEKALPELTDDFAKNAGLGAETVLDLRVKARTFLEEDQTKNAQSGAEAAMLDELIKVNEFEVPQALIDDEIRGLLSRTGLVDTSKVDLSQMNVESFRAGLGGVALKRVKSAILVDRIAQKESIKASDEEVSARIAEVSQQNGVAESEVRKYLESNGQIYSLMLDITRNKAIKFLMDRTTVEYFEPKEEKQEEKK